MQKLKKQRGLSLLELVVSLSLGMIILLGLINVYQIGAQSSRQADSIIDMNATANDIMMRFANDFRQAGYVDLLAADPGNPGHTIAEKLILPSGLPDFYQGKLNGGKPFQPPIEQVIGIPGVFGCMGAMNAGQVVKNTKNNGKFTKVSGISCGAAGDGLHQSLQISYQINSNASEPMESVRAQTTNDESGWDTDCLGTQVGADTYGFVSNRYFLDADGELKCSGNAEDPAQPIADGVREFVVHYHVSPKTDKGAKTTAGLETIGVLGADKILDTQKNPLGLLGITAVDVCLVLESEDNYPDIVELQPTLPSCSGKKIPRPAGNRHYFRRYVSSFSIPNQIFVRQGGKK